MRFLIPVIALSLVPHGCQTVNPAPGKLHSEPALAGAVSDKDSRLSAHAEAAEFANTQNTPGPAQQATAGALSVVRSLAGPATDKDRSEAMKLVNAAIAGRLAEAQKGWTDEKANAEALKASIADLNAKLEAERASEQGKIDAAIKAAGDKANAERKRLITLIFFGLGGLGVAGGVVMLVLAAQNPVFGPRMALATVLGGAALIVTGIAINAIENLIETHPWVIWTGIGAAVVAAVVAGTMAYSNHLHADSPAKT